jgi:hypothetical protein
MDGGFAASYDRPSQLNLGVIPTEMEAMELLK